MKPQGKVTIFMIVMIVMLSIYYFALPNNKSNVGTVTTNDPSSQTLKSEQYTELRAELNESRQTMITTLQGVLASTSVSADDKNTAIESIQKIQTMAQNEGLLETSIMQLGYDDVFVKADENKVDVSVYTDNLTLQEVNKMILMAKTQFGSGVTVSVNYTILDVN